MKCNSPKIEKKMTAVRFPSPNSVYSVPYFEGHSKSELMQAPYPATLR